MTKGDYIAVQIALGGVTFGLVFDHSTRPFCFLTSLLMVVIAQLRPRQPEFSGLQLEELVDEKDQRIATLENETDKLNQTIAKQEQDDAAKELRRKTPPKVTVTPSRWKNSVTITIRSLNGVAYDYDWYVKKYGGGWTVPPLGKMEDSFTPDKAGMGLNVSLDLSKVLRSLYVEELALDFQCSSINLKEIPHGEQHLHRKRCVFRLRWYPQQEKMEVFTEAGEPVESLEALTQTECKATNPPKTVPWKLPETK